MGLLGSYMTSQHGVGTSLADDAAANATKAMDESLQIITSVLDQIGGDDPRKSLAAAQQFKAFAENLQNQADSNTGSLVLSLPSTGNGVTAVEGGKQLEASTEPSIEETLGAELLKQTGGDPLRARQWLTVLVDVFGVDVNLPDYVSQVVASLKRDSYPDKVVNHGGNFELRSTVALRKRATALETGFDELVEKICGNLIHNEPIEDATRRALVELGKKSAAGTIDDTKLFAAVETFTKIKPNTGETFVDYLGRAMSGQVNSINTDHLDRVAKLINFDRSAGESDKDFAPRLREELKRLARVAAAGSSSGYTSLLDAVGDVLGYKRDTAKKEADADYRNRLLTDVLPYFQKTTDWAEKDLAKMRALADHNGVEYDTKETPYAIVRKMINEKGGFRHTLKNV